MIKFFNKFKKLFLAHSWGNSWLLLRLLITIIMITILIIISTIITYYCVISKLYILFIVKHQNDRYTICNYSPLKVDCQW